MWNIESHPRKSCHISGVPRLPQNCYRTSKSCPVSCGYLTITPPEATTRSTAFGRTAGPRERKNLHLRLSFGSTFLNFFSAIRQILSREPYFVSICESVSAAFGELSAARPERKDPRHERGKSARCEPWPRSAAPGFHKRESQLKRPTRFNFRK